MNMTVLLSADTCVRLILTILTYTFKTSSSFLSINEEITNKLLKCFLQKLVFGILVIFTNFLTNEIFNLNIYQFFTDCEGHHILTLNFQVLKINFWLVL